MRMCKHVLREEGRMVSRQRSHKVSEEVPKTSLFQRRAFTRFSRCANMFFFFKLRPMHPVFFLDLFTTPSCKIHMHVFKNGIYFPHFIKVMITVTPSNNHVPKKSLIRHKLIGSFLTSYNYFTIFHVHKVIHCR